MYSVVYIGVSDWVYLLVTAHGIPVSVASITGDVSSVSSIKFYIGSAISVIK